MGGQDAGQRYYRGTMGRFWSVDPGGIATANPADPTSWNRYAYVQGDPVNHADRHGLFLDAEQCIDDPDACEDEDWGGSGGGGGGGGCGYANGFNLLDGPTPDPGCPVQPTPPTSTAPPPSCDDLLMASLTNFLSGTKFASDAFAFEAAGASYNIDPRLIAAMAFAENGQAKNNPFGLGPNGSSSFSALGSALASLGSTLDRYIYSWHETTVSQLWSGNTWQVDPKKKWITIQYPAYCVGTTSADVAGCQATGANISQFMVKMTANPNSLGFPCPE